MDKIIIERLTEFIEKYKKFEDEEKFDEAIQEVENVLLYIQTKLEGVLNFMDREVLKSYHGDCSIVKRTMHTNKKLFELEERVDNLSSQIGRLTKQIDDKSELR